MYRHIAVLLAALTAVCASAAPVPIPPPKAPYPTSLAVTQGLVTRSLTVPNASCVFFIDSIQVASGVQRITLAQPDGHGAYKTCVANGSYLQFVQSAGPIHPQWIFPAPPPPPCNPPTLPAPLTQPRTCPIGTSGAWTQTATYAAAAPQVPPDGCWVLGPYLPATPPAGACTAVQPPPGQWQAPQPGSTFPIVAKPAKGETFVGPYGMPTTRVTDHTADVGQTWLAAWYNRHQAFNADNTLFVVFQPNGYWDVYRTSDGAFLKHLNGPAGDCEFQWSVTDPNAAYFLPINGGAPLRKMDVAANTSTIASDFGAAARALFPGSSRYWTKSEGSPTADGRYLGLMAENDGFTAVYGFFKLDTQTNSIVWHMPNPNGTTIPDNVTISPSGRWFIVSGLAPVGTKAYATDGSGTVRNLHPGVEHAEIGTLPNGHDFIVTENYQANGGPIFAIDIDTGQTLPFELDIYNNPLFDNPPGVCVNCAVWPSARALYEPGWIIISTTEHAPSNVFLANVTTNQLFGVTAIYNVRVDYWDEAHCTVSRDLRLMLCTMNFRHSLDNDVYLTRLNPLPATFPMPIPPASLNKLAPPPKVLPASLHAKKPSLIGK
jgi:hypothetical protein